VDPRPGFAGGTALDMLARLDLGGDDRMLVLGASGGVGSYLLQLAAARGITVYAVGRAEHHDRMRAGWNVRHDRFGGLAAS
jgi:NADPH:quinone reductase